MRRILLIVTVAGLLVVATPAAVAQETVTVEAQDNKFSPASIDVEVGDSITFRNTGKALHNAQDKAGSFTTGDMLAGQSRPVTFDSEGTFELVCSYHEALGMTGQIVVKPVAAPAEAATPNAEAFDPDAGVPIGMKAFPLLAGGMLLLLVLGIGMGYIRNVQKNSESQ